MKRCAARNPEKIKARAKEYGKSEKWRTWHNEYRRGKKKERALEARQYRANNREKVLAYKRDWYAKNKERLQQYRADYVKKNPWFNRAASARNRALRIQRTPEWANMEAIKKFYKECPVDKVVDHQIPLRGKIVSGLHVPNNFQYLTPKDNNVKGNRW
jgi:hypothetical protein